MNRELLEKPFDRSLVKSRKGSFGQSLSYVEIAQYVKRLNDAFDGDWSFEIVDQKILENEVLVVGKLVAGNVTKMAIGNSRITYSKSTGEQVSLGDDLKASESIALKRACRLFGLGLDLYCDDQPPASAGNGRQARGNGGNGQNRGNGGNGHANGNRLTQKQLSAIWSMGRSLGLNADAIRQRSQEGYGAMPEHLSKTDASSFISALSAEISGDGGAA